MTIYATYIDFEPKYDLLATHICLKSSIYLRFVIALAITAINVFMSTCYVFAPSIYGLN